MPEYIFLVHDDAVDDAAGSEAYLTKLQKVGVFRGGSEIGKGIGDRKSGSTPPISNLLTGFIRVAADSLEDAQVFWQVIRSSKPAEPSRSGNCRDRIDQSDGRRFVSPEWSRPGTASCCKNSLRSATAPRRERSPGRIERRQLRVGAGGASFARIALRLRIRGDIGKRSRSIVSRSSSIRIALSSSGRRSPAGPVSTACVLCP